MYLGQTDPGSSAVETAYNCRKCYT